MAEEERMPTEEELEKLEEMADGLEAFGEALESDGSGDAGQMFDFLLGMREMMGDEGPKPVVFPAGHVDFDFFEADVEEPWCILQTGEDDDKVTLFGKGSKISELRKNKVLLMVGIRPADDDFPETKEEFESGIAEAGFKKVDFGGRECFYLCQEGSDMYIWADFDKKISGTIGILAGGDEAKKVAETIRLKI